MLENVWNTRAVFDLVLQGTERKWDHPNVHLCRNKIKNVKSKKQCGSHLFLYTQMRENMQWVGGVWAEAETDSE